MKPKMNSPISLILLDRLNRPVFEFTRSYNECAEVTVIFRDEKTYVYQRQTEFSDNKIFFKEVKQILDLNPPPVLTSLDAEKLNIEHILKTLKLLHNGEISLSEGLQAVNYWAEYNRPFPDHILEQDKSDDNPLIDEAEAPMDVLRRVREDIIVRREQDQKDAALIAALLAVAGPRMDQKWKQDLGDIVERLTADAHGKPVPEEMKARHTIHIQAGGRVKGLSLKEGVTEVFEFLVKDDGVLTPAMQNAGVTVKDVPGIGRVASLPIQGMFDGSVVGKKVASTQEAMLQEINDAAHLAMRQFADNVNGALQKFRDEGN